jgi:hypothetical protein
MMRTKTPRAAFLLGFLGWIAGMALAGAAGAANLADLLRGIDVPEESRACLECHTQRALGAAAIRDWVKSRHAANGVACADCHIPVKDAPEAIHNAPSTCEDSRVRRGVSPSNCAQCHDDKVQEFSKGKHAKAWLAMGAMPTTFDQPEAIIRGEKGCGGCHRIGRDEGKCDACHTRHLFSAAEARRPEACMTCHMGFDHPQWEMYSTSKHGTIYAVEKEKWDFSKPISEWYADPVNRDPGTPRAPMCATCHMPDGNHEVRTAWGFLALRLPEDDQEWMGYRATILRGLGVLDEEGQPTDRLSVVQAGDVARLTKEAWQAERDKMISVCSKCHTPSFAKLQLARADSIIKAADALMAEAIEIVEGLYKDGILERQTDIPLSVDLLRFYEVSHPIEQKLYVMFLEHRMRTFQGAFHMNPDYMHWYGWAEMKRDLIEIRTEAEELRRAAGK